MRAAYMFKSVQGFATAVLRGPESTYCGSTTVYYSRLSPGAKYIAYSVASRPVRSYQPHRVVHLGAQSWLDPIACNEVEALTLTSRSRTRLEAKSGLAM